MNKAYFRPRRRWGEPYFYPQRALLPPDAYVTEPGHTPMQTGRPVPGSSGPVGKAGRHEGPWAPNGFTRAPRSAGHCSATGREVSAVCFHPVPGTTGERSVLREGDYSPVPALTPSPPGLVWSPVCEGKRDSALNDGDTPETDPHDPPRSKGLGDNRAVG